MITKKFSFQMVVGSIISIMFFYSCNSNRGQNQSQQDTPASNQTEITESNLSNSYETINKLCVKMQEEGETFYPKTQLKVLYHNGIYDLGQVYPTATVALSEAINHGYIIVKDKLTALKQGENITVNLQEIDGHCYQIEKQCADGIIELGDSEEYISGPMKDTWISVLKRIKKYSSEIRNQVQFIREVQ